MPKIYPKTKVNLSSKTEGILGHEKTPKNALNLPKTQKSTSFPKFTENPKVNKFPKISYVLVSLCSTQLSTLIELAAVFHRLDLVRFQPSIWFVCKTVFKQSLVGLQDRAFGWFARLSLNRVWLVYKTVFKLSLVGLQDGL